MASVELPVPGAAIVLGVKLAVVPEGKFEIDRLRELLNPYTAVVVILDVTCFPTNMLSVDGDAAMVNDGMPFTVRATVVLCCTLPPLPVTVML
jgi:hypothetical protein